MPEFQNVFIASAIHSAVIVGVFVLMWLKTDDSSRIQKRLWLVGIFISLVYAFAVEQRGFDALEFAYAWSGGEELAALARGAMFIMMWGAILIFGWSLFTLMYELLRSLYDTVVLRKRKYGRDDETT